MIAIAIDGPAGAGNSSIARGVARELGYIYVDTGALYRTVGLAVSRSRIDLEDRSELEALLKNTDIRLVFQGGEQRVLLNGVDVSDEIRTPEASLMASRVSARPTVRAFLLSLQRELAETNNVLMDGRDIGTVVLPNAQIKYFLTASIDCRAQRRYRELTEKGQDVRLEDVRADIEKRDYDDSHRAIAPLKAAADAEIIDNTGMQLEQSVAALTARIRDRLEEIAQKG